MNCDTARDRLGALADGELRGPARWRLQSHVARYRTCAEEARRLQSLERLLRSATVLPVDVPASAAATLSISVERRKRRLRRAAAMTLVIAGAGTIRWVDTNLAPTYPIRSTIEPMKVTGPNAAHFYAAAMDAFDTAYAGLDIDAMKFGTGAAGSGGPAKCAITGAGPSGLPLPVPGRQ